MTSIDEVAKEVAPKWLDGRCMGGTEAIAKAGILAGLQMAAEVCDGIQRQKLNASLDYATGRHMACEVCKNEILALKGGGE